MSISSNLLLKVNASRSNMKAIMLSLVGQTVLWSSSAAAVCKTTPSSPMWPCAADWQALNKTLSGRLLEPAPPAAVCHPTQPSFDAAVCKNTDWTDATTYANDPLGIINPNWSNDSCLPQPKFPCTGKGFPVYVVNASSPEHVSTGIKFAKKHNIRLNVKGSGHDYLGR